jgi:hypothetical protein
MSREFLKGSQIYADTDNWPLNHFRPCIVLGTTHWKGDTYIQVRFLDRKTKSLVLESRCRTRV